VEFKIFIDKACLLEADIKRQNQEMLMMFVRGHPVAEIMVEYGLSREKVNKAIRSTVGRRNRDIIDLRQLRVNVKEE